MKKVRVTAEKEAKRSTPEVGREGKTVREELKDQTGRQQRCSGHDKVGKRVDGTLN